MKRQLKTAKAQNDAAARWYLTQPDQTSELQFHELCLLDSWLKAEVSRLEAKYPDLRCVETECISYVPGSLEGINEQVEAGVLHVYSGGSASRLWAENNTLFRRIHDLHHHEYQLGFSLEDEYELYDTLWRKPNVSPLVKQVLRSEIYYQAATYHRLGKFPDEQKLVLTSAGMGL